MEGKPARLPREIPHQRGPRGFDAPAIPAGLTTALWRKEATDRRRKKRTARRVTSQAPSAVMDRKVGRLAWVADRRSDMMAPSPMGKAACQIYVTAVTEVRCILQRG